jgi:prepilin-type N-terminal cleavage/methylation domain-containing protein
MKLTNTHNMKRKSGMTLLELTVVILVLLSLISILFIGARAWKKGSDRAGCILNIRNTQQAVRSFGNMYGVEPGAALSTSNMATDPATLADAIVGTGNFMTNAPTCPASGTYSGLTATSVPAVGGVALTCSLASSDNHAPTNTGDW